MRKDRNVSESHEAQTSKIHGLKFEGLRSKKDVRLSRQGTRNREYTNNRGDCRPPRSRTETTVRNVVVILRTT